MLCSYCCKFMCCFSRYIHTLAPWPCVAFRETAKQQMYKGQTGTETPHTVGFQCFLLVPPKGWLEKQLWSLRKVGSSRERLTGREVGQPKEMQKDSVKSDPHQETWAACWGRTILHPKERTKHTVHVTKDTLVPLRLDFWLKTNSLHIFNNYVMTFFFHL